MNAVVHTHSTFCTTISCLRRDVPAFHYVIAAVGASSIKCAPYATFGTRALCDGVVAALADRNACLMANHGMTAVGNDLTGGLGLATMVEELCRVYYYSLQVSGGPVILDNDEMALMQHLFKAYGKQSAGGGLPDFASITEEYHQSKGRFGGGTGGGGGATAYNSGGGSSKTAHIEAPLVNVTCPEQRRSSPQTYTRSRYNASSASAPGSSSKTAYIKAPSVNVTCPKQEQPTRTGSSAGYSDSWRQHGCRVDPSSTLGRYLKHGN